MITRIRRVALFVWVLLAFASIVHAAPAPDATFVLRQPDGTSFEAQLFGDEWMNGTETVDGYTIVQDAASGYWTYANATSAGALVATVYVVGRDRPSAIPRGLRPPALAPEAAPEGFGPEPGVAAMGSRPTLVLLVQFSDQSGATTAAQWRSRFFGTGMSVREHYRRASLGGLDITPAAERHGTVNDGIVGWLTLDRAHPDFGGTVDARAGRLARDAMTAASRHVDFAALDTDGDGRVSTSELLVVVVVAGHDASLPGACRPSVWSHQSAIRPLPLDGVELSPYAMVGESHCAAPTTLDNIAHEVDHLLGVADIAAAEQSLAVPLAATLTLTAPNGDEGWTTNSQRRIAWTSSGVTGNVRLEVSRNGGATWAVIAASTPNDGTFNWTVTGPATSSARVRVCSVNTPALCDASNGNFRIAAAIITVVAPNGGESWVIGTTQPIRWISAGPVGSNVRIELSRNGGTSWTPIFASVANDSTQNWLVTGPATTAARIRVCSTVTPSVCDTSNSTFRIVTGALVVVTPNGGESWSTGSTQRIAWTSSGAVGGSVRIEVSRNGGASWTPIFASVVNDGAQNWLVTGPVTTAARIRVCSVATPSLCDASNANFTISDGRVRVLTPNGGESWPVGGVRRIAWTSSVAGNVRIEVSRDGGASWTPIFSNIANDGAQNWTVTGPGTSQARIRVCSIAVPTACDTSDANFSISETADLTVRFLSFTPTNLLGGQAWQVRVQTANDGVAPAPASRTDVFIGPTSATGTILITSINVPALAPGEVSDQRKTIAFPFTVAPGTYFVFVRVDATGVVPEGDGGNEFVLLAPTLLVF